MPGEENEHRNGEHVEHGDTKEERSTDSMKGTQRGRISASPYRATVQDRGARTVRKRNTESMNKSGFIPGEENVHGNGEHVEHGDTKEEGARKV